MRRASLLPERLKHARIPVNEDFMLWESCQKFCPGRVTIVGKEFRRIPHQDHREAVAGEKPSLARGLVTKSKTSLASSKHLK